MKHRNRFLATVCLPVAVPLAGCTLSVANIAPTPPTGDTLSLVQEVMAEAAATKSESEQPAADQAIDAVVAWRAGGDSG